MDAKKEVLQLLADQDCPLIRTGLHNVYRLPSGERFVTPVLKQSGGAWGAAWRNNLSDLKALLGISKRGHVATTGERREKVRKSRPSKSDIPEDFTPAPARLGFGDKMRLAVNGTRTPTGFQKRYYDPPDPIPQDQGPEFIAASSLPGDPAPVPAKRFRRPITIRKDRERHGAVRIWSREEIEAANTAMRMGQLDNFMQEHYEAANPASIQPHHKEERQMLSVEHIDGSIEEIEQGMKVALDEQRAEQAVIQKLEEEAAQARLRLKAAVDKHNSLLDVKTTLAVIRADIERVRPMLGHIAQTPTPMMKASHRARITGIRLVDAVRQVLEEATEPMPVRVIHELVMRKPGCESIARTSLYTFLSNDKRRNGDAVAHRVGDNLYVRSGRELPMTQGGVA